MNSLDPELRRLIRWARQAPEPAPEPPPLGFIARVAARAAGELPQSEPGWWLRLQNLALWSSLAIVVVGLTLATRQVRAPATTYDLAPAFQFAAHTIAP
ncbi:MAG TPA: hypothetical protein VLD18_01300 [Verrucomicrobiae bacterium]|nr:hypothetical protein [Verrucomicrobiae bacterium]